MIIKRIQAVMLLLSLGVLFLPPLGVSAAEEAPVEVYTQFVSGNFNHAGDGTAAAPYNLFEDALADVADGGTIYIAGSSAFINDTSDNAPFAITKNVTISAAPGAADRPLLDVWTCGMILGGNVRFRNVILAFANGFRPIICANGYTLELENTSYAQHTRMIHLAGGSMYGYTSLASGEHSRIIVKGKTSSFGNIYAGSINHSFDKAVDITVEGVSGQNLACIYASGAKEGYYNSENFMDPSNEPKPPGANPEAYPVSGKVIITLNETGVSAVDGNTGSGVNASLSIAALNRHTCTVANISALTVQRGVFAPDFMNDGADITICEGGTLDISELINCEANNFMGGGTLVMAYDGCLTINGTCTGETEFQTSGGTIDYSYLVQYDYLYIKTTGDGTFILRPYPTQNGVKLEKCEEGWRTSVQPELVTPTLTEFDIATSATYVCYADINGSTPPELKITTAFTEDTIYGDISMIPLEYTVTYQGVEYAVSSDTLPEDYYEGNVPALHMTFCPIADTIMISGYSEAFGYWGEIAAGVYDIAVTAPTATGRVTRTVQLTVLDDTKDEPAIRSVEVDNNHAITVRFANVSDKDMEQAALLVAGYNGEAFVQALCGTLSVKQGEEQEVRFTMDGEPCSVMKIFAWSSLDSMNPLIKPFVLSCSGKGNG